MNEGRVLHDGKPEASAAGPPGMALIDTVETLKDAFLLFFRDSDTGIFYDQDRSGIFDRSHDRDTAAFFI